MSFGTLQLFVLAVVLLLALGALASSALVPLAVRGTTRWAPESRHRSMLLLAWAPWALSGAALLAVSLPSLGGALGIRADHCLVHGGHSHLCFVHPAQHVGDAGVWLAIGAAGAWLLLRAMRWARELRAAARLAREVLASAQPAEALGVWTLPSEQPLCVSIGLLQPTIVLSSRVLRELQPAALEVLVAHERAHAERRDALVRLGARAASACLLPFARRALLSALDLAAEQVCDERAAQRVGDRLRVAETILHMERQHSVAPSPVHGAFSLGFATCAVAERVEAMLAPPREAGASLWLAALLACGIAALLGSYEHVHHATETLLAFVQH